MSATNTPSNAAVPRTRLRRTADDAVARLLKLPPATTDYTKTSDLRIPMRDGAILLADHLAPVGDSRGTVLIRGPYGFNAITATALGGLLARYGYDVVLARVRGTFGSGGTFEPFVHEVDDAADTVAWLRQQPFFEGRFATFGGSYLGLTQWALLMDPPPELATTVMQVAPHDMSRSIYDRGALNLETWLGWSDQVAHQEQVSFLGSLWRSATAARRQASANAVLPVTSAADELCEGRAPFFREWASHRDLSDPFWSGTRFGDALDKVEVPVLLQTGWQDVFLDQTLEQYEHLRNRGVEVGLSIGPWTHQAAALRGYETLIPEALDWLAEHLDQTSTARKRSPVRVQITGTEDWREMAVWPPTVTHGHIVYPHSDGSLGDQPATADSPPAAFTYDPADPTPAVGGRTFHESSNGYRDDTKLAERADVLSFTGPPLTSPLEVIGVPVVELAHSTDNPHVDLFVRISEVDAKGRSRNVTDSFVRLDPAAAGATISLELDPIAHRFAAGNRIRLLVAGGAFPRYERNLGTAEDPGTSTVMKRSNRTLELGGTRVVLPVTR